MINNKVYKTFLTSIKPIKVLNLVKKVFLVILFMLTKLDSLAQVDLALLVENIQLKNEFIRTTKIVNAPQTIGELIDSKGSKISLNLKPNLESALRIYLNSQEVNPKGKQIEIDIKSFKLEEKIEGNLITGSIKMEISARVYHDISWQKLCSANSSATYQRSSKNIPYELIRKQIQSCIDKNYLYIKNHIQKNKNSIEAFSTSSQVVIYPFRNVPNADTLYYQQRAVKWDDFRAKTKSKTPYGAMIFASFGYNSRVYTNQGKITMEIYPMVYMTKDMSWARSEMKTSYALDHEQLHFDICYLTTLEFLANIKALKAISEDELISKVKLAYLDFYRKSYATQETYDEETNHSLVKEQQEAWTKKIRQQVAQFPMKTIFDR
ncbi:MAG: hypothetical protein ACRCVT_09515 [Leadbetterella sp.]